MKLFSEDEFPECVVRGTEKSGAIFGPEKTFDGEYVFRYALWRVWDAKLPIMVWCMLNPSTASHLDDDATIRKNRGFGEREGYGGNVVVNLFGLRSRYPSRLLQASNPIGPHNELVILRVLTLLKAPKLWCAWGNPGSGHLGKIISRRADLLPSLLRHVSPVPQLWCLKRTKEGHPWHPVMLGYTQRSEPWAPPAV